MCLITILPFGRPPNGFLLSKWGFGAAHSLSEKDRLSITDMGVHYHVH